MTDYSTICRCYEYDDEGMCIDCHCPAAWKPHSHWVSDSCALVVGVCLGTCNYECDPPYVWNPVTQQCELPVVGEARWDGYYFLDTG